MTAQIIGSLGIVLNMLGVVGLFRYGMPFRIGSGGAKMLAASPPTAEGRKMDARYAGIGKLSLSMVLLGNALQVMAVWMV